MGFVLALRTVAVLEMKAKFDFGARLGRWTKSNRWRTFVIDGFSKNG